MDQPSISSKKSRDMHRTMMSTIGKESPAAYQFSHRCVLRNSDSNAETPAIFEHRHSHLQRYSSRAGANEFETSVCITSLAHVMSEELTVREKMTVDSAVRAGFPSGGKPFETFPSEVHSMRWFLKSGPPPYTILRMRQSSRNRSTTSQNSEVQIGNQRARSRTPWSPLIPINHMWT